MHKCHGGVDSLVTSREAFEIATRFFFGNIRARLRLSTAKVTRGQGPLRQERVLLRRLDQAAAGRLRPLPSERRGRELLRAVQRTDENGDVIQRAPEKLAFGWADDSQLIWEGYLDTSQ